MNKIKEKYLVINGYKLDLLLDYNLFYSKDTNTTHISFYVDDWYENDRKIFNELFNKMTKRLQTQINILNSEGNFVKNFHISHNHYFWNGQIVPQIINK